MDNLHRYADVEVFRNDVYEMKVKTLVDHYFLVANYNQSSEFDSFWRVNIITNEVEQIDLDDAISFDAYFMGTDDGMAYLYDRENKVQYQINVAQKNVTEVGDESLGIKILKDDEWEWLEIDELTEDVYFQTNDEAELEFRDDYADVQTVMGELGFIYYLASDGTEYRVYRAPRREPDYKKYLFSLSEPENLSFVYDFVYFREDEKIKYYNDATGLKTLVENSEFAFNDSLDFGVYIRR